MTQPLYCAGERIETDSTHDVMYPYDGTVSWTVSMASEKDVDRSIQAAYDARPAMQALEPYQRATILRHIVDQLKKQQEDFAQLLVKENGKTIKEARGEMSRCITTFQIAIGHAEQQDGEAYDLWINKASAWRYGIVRHFPIGVVSGIIPFNFPMNLAAHKIAPAIAAWCPIVCKPARATPLTLLKFAKIIEESDLPKGAFSVLPCDRQIGQQLVEDPRIALLSFTGSPQVWWKMKQQAGKKKVVLELGWNAAAIVDEHIDNRDYLIDRMVMGAFYQAGQSCISVQRILCHEKVYETFKKKFTDALQRLEVGDPLDEQSFIGWIIDQKNRERLQSRIDEAMDRGASCLAWNFGEWTLLHPTILENVPKDTAIHKEEAFGPVVSIDTFASIDEAIEKVNDSVFGLQVGVFSNHISHVRKVFEWCEVGGVVHNDVPSFRVDSMPYGGVKDSWLWREGIKYAMHDMLEPRVLVVNKK